MMYARSGGIGRSLLQNGTQRSAPVLAQQQIQTQYMSMEKPSLSLSLSDMVSKLYHVPIKLIEFLQENGTYESDIFRTVYYPDDFANLAHVLRNPATAATVRLSEYSISSVATALKRALRFRFPLFPLKYYDLLLEIQRRQYGDAKILSLAALVSAFPRDNRVVLAALFELLAAVSENSYATMMDSRLMAYIFAPILIAPPMQRAQDVAQVMAEQKQLNELIIDLIENHDQIFELPEDEAAPQEDEDNSRCNSCKTNFSLLTRQKHCVVCWLPFCSKCSSRKIDGSRACDVCFELQAGQV